jgi:hypothetical protein
VEYNKFESSGARGDALNVQQRLAKLNKTMTEQPVLEPIF